MQLSLPPNKELNCVKGLPRLVVSIERSPARLAGLLCSISTPCAPGALTLKSDAVLQLSAFGLERISQLLQDRQQLLSRPAIKACWNRYESIQTTSLKNSSL
jgi:hypothetical protein